MEVVWKKGVATVADVVEDVTGDPPLAYSTVLTTLRILENKGYLIHSKQGRAFVTSRSYSARPRATTPFATCCGGFSMAHPSCSCSTFWIARGSAPKSWRACENASRRKND